LSLVFLTLKQGQWERPVAGGYSNQFLIKQNVQNVFVVGFFAQKEVSNEKKMGQLVLIMTIAKAVVFVQLNAK